MSDQANFHADTKRKEPPVTPEARSRWRLKQVERLLEYPAPSSTTQRHRLNLAERLLEQVQAETPAQGVHERSYYWEVLSRSWFRQRNIARTEHCLRRMANLQPGCADAYLNLGSYLTEMGIHDKAMQAYWEGLRVSPSDQYIIYNLASLYRSSGQQQLALKVLDDAIRAADNPAILQKAKADLLCEWGHSALAAECYELALSQLNTKDLGFHQETMHSLAECYQASGETEKAVSTWEHALQIFSQDHKALFHLTVLHYQRKEWQQTINYGQRLLATGERQGDILKLINLSCSKLGVPQVLPLPVQESQFTATPVKFRKLTPLELARADDRHDEFRAEAIQTLMARGYSRKDAEGYVDAFL